MKILREPIVDFANQMEERLEELDGEKGTEGWLDPTCRISYLENKLQDKTRKLRNYFDDMDQIGVDKTCTDIANFAMMICHRLEMLRNM